MRQRDIALKHANDVRLKAARLKRELYNGDISIHQAIYSTDADPITIYRLLESKYKFGRTTVLAILSRAEVPEGRRVRDLTPGQIKRILREVPNGRRRASRAT